MESVYVYLYKEKLKQVFKTLELAKHAHPGAWNESDNGPFEGPEYWWLGEAEILKMEVLEEVVPDLINFY